MAVRSLDESNRLFAVEVDMENRSSEEIARDAVMQINAPLGISKTSWS